MPCFLFAVPSSLLFLFLPPPPPPSFFFFVHGSSKAPIVILTVSASSQAKGKGPEMSANPVEPVVAASPVQATGQSRFKLPGFFHDRIPLDPLFAEGFPPPYIPRWKITPSIVISTPEIAWDFMAHALPPSHRFMNFVLDPEIFDDQYSLSICEGFLWVQACCKGSML
ncbi:hypothetical protein HanHA89_Chr09g0331541 [Helianthus annuus]|nr:hypothetical protein HanHA89_Chr09g0331541 [Helianthus annuus]